MIQTVGRAARNSNGYVIMYADKVTRSMQVAIDETERRREIQQAYNEEHGITPQTIKKNIHAVIEATKAAEDEEEYEAVLNEDLMEHESLEGYIKELEEEMMAASQALQFERAAELRDRIVALKEKLSKQ